MRHRRRAVVVLAVLGALLIVAVVFLRHPLTSLNELQTIAWPHRYSAEAWRDQPRQRYHMAEDLVQQGLLRGKSQAEVLAMLGAPAGPVGPTEADLTDRDVSWSWWAASPQRPGDSLIVVFKDGAVHKCEVTSDPMSMEDAQVP